MSLSPDLVSARCAEIDESARRLEAIAAIPVEEFLGDRDLRDIACYRLLIAIEAALSLCFHVASREFRQVPDGYAGCFGLLAERGWIDTELGERLKGMARFRNMLVHVDWTVDYVQVHNLLRSKLGDLRAFGSRVTREV
jgi:uncharacterized protein YutE (UPF0331/DUF86 family)